MKKNGMDRCDFSGSSVHASGRIIMKFCIEDGYPGTCQEVSVDFTQ